MSSKESTNHIRLIVKSTKDHRVVGKTVLVDVSSGIHSIKTQLSLHFPFEVRDLLHVVYNDAGHPIATSSIDTADVLGDMDLVVCLAAPGSNLLPTVDPQLHPSKKRCREEFETLEECDTRPDQTPSNAQDVSNNVLAVGNIASVTSETSLKEEIRLIVKNDKDRDDEGKLCTVDIAGGLPTVLQQLASHTEFASIIGLSRLVYKGVGRPVATSTIESVDELNDTDIVLAVKSLEYGSTDLQQAKSTAVVSIKASTRASGILTTRDEAAQPKENPCVSGEPRKVNIEVGNTDGAEPQNQIQTSPFDSDRQPSVDEDVGMCRSDQ